jgi:tetratricopeptide (TPR) repeat protein
MRIKDVAASVMDAGNKDKYVKGWFTGWTLSAATGELFRETASPLGVHFSDQPGVINLKIPGLEAQVALPLPEKLSCQLCAEGIRILGESGEHTSVSSCFKLDANTLLIESETKPVFTIKEPAQGQLLEDGACMATTGIFHMVCVSAPSATTSRLVVHTGKGDQRTLAAKARGFLTTASAHEHLDAALIALHADASLSAKSFSLVFHPMDYLKSRLRAASPHIPYPWIADADEQPIWDLSILYPIIQAMIGRHDDIAEGLIQNFVELVDQDGCPPIAGGAIDKPRHGPAAFPLLVRIYFSFHQETGMWPGDIGRSIESLSRYLVTAIRRTHELPADDDFSELYRTLVHSEVVIWNDLHLLASRPKEAALDRVTSESRSLHHHHGDSRAGQQPWIAILDRREKTSLRQATAGTFLDIVKHRLVNLDDSFNPSIVGLSIIASEELSQIDHREYYRWLQELDAAADTVWSYADESVRETRCLYHDLEFIAITGFMSRVKARHATLLRARDNNMHLAMMWLSRHRRALVSAIGLFLLLGAGWLLMVQFRPTMPLTVFETQIGLAMQHYKNEDWDSALVKLAEIQRRGHSGNELVGILKANVQFRKHDYQSALDGYQELLRKNPGNINARFNLGLSFFRMKQYDEARQQFSALSAEFNQTHPFMSERSRLAATIIDEMDNGLSRNDAQHE